MAHSPQYKLALVSDYWRALSASVFQQRGPYCQRCGKFSLGLELHHLTYDRVGRERPQDVVIVCRVCHPDADRERQWAVETAAEESRFDAWATARFGDEPMNWPEDAGERFDEFCRRVDGYG